MKIFKELREWWDFVYFCLWVGNWSKALRIYNEFIDPLAKEHPIMNFFASII